MVGLLVIGFLLNRKKWLRFRMACFVMSALIFLIMGNGVLYEYTCANAFKDYNMAELKKPHYDVAIVMGGFSTIHVATGQLIYAEDRAGRLWEAVRLYKIGKVDRILISGDSASDIRPDGKSTVKMFFDYMADFGVPDSAFIIEPHARNSIENAEFSVKMLKNLGIDDSQCLLITNVSHMERSLQSFKKFDFEPDWYSVGLFSNNILITHNLFYPDWRIMVKWQTLFKEWIGKVAYSVML